MWGVIPFYFPLFYEFKGFEVSGNSENTINPWNPETKWTVCWCGFYIFGCISGRFSIDRLLYYTRLISSLVYQSSIRRSLLWYQYLTIWVDFCPHAIHSNTVSGSQIYSLPNMGALSCLLEVLILSGLLGSIRQREFNFNCKAFEGLWNHVL